MNTDNYYTIIIGFASSASELRLQAIPQVLQIELQVRSVVGLPHVLIGSVRGTVLSGMIGLANTSIEKNYIGETTSYRGNTSSTTSSSSGSSRL